jgi:hypothetical protein
MFMGHKNLTRRNGLRFSVFNQRTQNEIFLHLIEEKIEQGR